ncbi:MAG: hypothetical protein JXB88_21115 [Spirochaetales bacterium]|nr:hypothetical protein [Spirochaetales bacterium]
MNKSICIILMIFITFNIYSNEINKYDPEYIVQIKNGKDTGQILYDKYGLPHHTRAFAVSMQTWKNKKTPSLPIILTGPTVIRILQMMNNSVKIPHLRNTGTGPHEIKRLHREQEPTGGTITFGGNMMQRLKPTIT